MLVLSRKHLEKVIITVPPCDEPTQILVHVVDIQSEKVRLGFDAKPSVKIDREEVHYRIHGIPVEEQIKEAMVRIQQPDCWYLPLKDRKGGDASEWAADLRVREFPTGCSNTTDLGKAVAK